MRTHRPGVSSGRLAPALLGLAPRWPLAVSRSPSSLLCRGRGRAAGTSPRPEPTPLPELERTACRAADPGRRPAGRAGLAGRHPVDALRAAGPRRGPAGDGGDGAAPRSTTTRRSTWACGSSTASPALVNRRLSRRDEPADADRFAIYLDPRLDRLHGRPLRGQRRRRAARPGHLQRHLDGRVVGRGLGVGVSHDDRAGRSRCGSRSRSCASCRAEHQTWGINARASSSARTRATGSRSCPKRESGLASRMATLVGHPGRRAEDARSWLVPYAAGTAEIGAVDRRRPVPRRPQRVRRASASTCTARSASAFALDATVNPDFGQVEVDPAVVNLTDFETFFPERRPFFVEGAQIFDSFGRNGPNNFYDFNRSEPDLFYTRRIGRAPQGETPEDYVDVPRTTTILGAAKMTGKSADGWSVGVLEAVTGARERALGERRTTGDGRRSSRSRTTSSGARSATPAAPATAPPRPSVSRDSGPGARRSPRRARARRRRRRLRVPGPAQGLGRRRARRRRARSPASRAAIEQLQLDPTRYFQRPDRAEPRLDPTLHVARQGGPAASTSTASRAPCASTPRVGHEPRLRVERPRLQPAQRPLGRPRRRAAAEARARRAHALPLAHALEVVRLQLRRRQAGRRRQRRPRARACATTGTSGSTAATLARARRPADARRALDEHRRVVERGPLARQRHAASRWPAGSRQLALRQRVRQPAVGGRGDGRAAALLRARRLESARR